MIKQYFTQAWAQLRQQPLISTVSIAGTALAIFLIMLVVMMQQVKVAPFAPESNRDRFLHVKSMSISNSNWGDGTSNGPMSVQTARECFQSLKTPEAVTIYTIFRSLLRYLYRVSRRLVWIYDKRMIFWRVFDFSFILGKPYDKAAFDAGQPVAVLTESVARSLFGTTDVAGRQFLLSHAPYRVAGVVKDVSTLADCAYGQVWVPYTSTGMDNNTWNDRHMGMMSCTMLAHSRDDFPAIRQEAERRKLEYNTLIGKNGWKLIYRNRPYDQEKNAIAFGANIEPDVDAARRQRIVIFVILLIVPAINLSSMTQSRLRQRVAEIGARRAFGSTRLELMGQIIAENLVVTLLAGIVGLLLSVAFAYLGNTLFLRRSSARP